MTHWHEFIKILANMDSYVPPFAEEDASILSEFGLQDLKDKYPKGKLIPDDISVKVGKAYSHIKKNRKLAEKNYLTESDLGKKIQAAVEHDCGFIYDFCRPVYDSCIDLEKNGAEIDLDVEDDQIKVKSHLLGKSKKNDEELTRIGGLCAERVNRYGLQKHVPKWGK